MNIYDTVDASTLQYDDIIVQDGNVLTLTDVSDDGSVILVEAKDEFGEHFYFSLEPNDRIDLWTLY